jgi:hypothetical protein
MQQSEALLFPETQEQRLHNVPANLFRGRASSIDGDSFDDVEEEGSTDEGELDEFLRWPPEMLIAHAKSKHKSGGRIKRYPETT